MIDTLKYSRELEAAGFTADQAELFVRSQVGMITDNVATKVDIRESLREVYDKIHGVENRIQHMDHRIDKLEQTMKSRFDQMASAFDLKLEKMFKRLATVIVSSGVFLSSGLGILFKFFS